MSRRDDSTRQPTASSGGLGALAVIGLVVAVLVWQQDPQPPPAPAAPDIVVEATEAAPVVVEGDTVNVAPPVVNVAPPAVTVEVEAPTAPIADPGEPPRPLTFVERAQSLAWRCLPSALTGPGWCLWQIVEAVR